MFKISDAEILLNEVMGRVTLNGRKAAYSMPEIYEERRYRRRGDDITEAILIAIPGGGMSNEGETDFSEEYKNAGL